MLFGLNPRQVEKIELRLVALDRSSPTIDLSATQLTNMDAAVVGLPAPCNVTDSSDVQLLNIDVPV